MTCRVFHALILLATSAQAATLVSNLNSPVSVLPSMTECCWEAASFVNDGSSHSLSSITVLIGNPVSSPSAFANLRADAGGLPGSVLIGLQVPAPPTSVDPTVLTPQSPFTLAPNTKYWLELGVFDDKNPSTNARFVWATVDNSIVNGTGSIPTEYAAFNVGFGFFPGGVQGVAQSIQVDVDAPSDIPEPATATLVAAALLFAAVRRRFAPR